MKHTILTLTITSLLAINAFADPIHDAAKVGDLAAVQAQLDAGVDVNAKDWLGGTALLEAAIKGHKEVVELLIAKGADVNAKDKYGKTPLYLAAERGHKEVASLREKVEGHSA